MKKIELTKDIFVITNFLNKEMCNLFIKKGEETSFEEAKVNISGKQTMVKGIRNNERILFKDEHLSQTLWHRVEPYVIKSFGTYTAIGLNEMFRIYKYSPKQRFKMHRDGSYERNEKECSFFSFLIYLNDTFTGGETYFEQGTTVVPKEGDALIFYHPFRHEGKPVLTGTKYVLRTDIMYRMP